MPAVSVKEPLRFIPDNLKEREDAPTFLIKVPTLRDRIALDACMAIEGARYPINSELAAALREGILEHVVDEETQPLLDIVLEYEAASEETGPVSQEILDQIEQIARVLRSVHRPLGRIESERGRFLATSMLIRAEMFLIGIEGVDAPKVEKRSGRLTEACQEVIEKKYGPGTLFAIGARTVEIATPTEDERKKLRIAGTIAARPRDFDGGPDAPDGSAWEIFGERYEYNPRLKLPSIYIEILRLWRLATPPPGKIVGMAAGMIPTIGHLPEPGGTLDQSAWLMDAFMILNEVEAKLAAPLG